VTIIYLLPDEEDDDRDAPELLLPDDEEEDLEPPELLDPLL
jgi:hypothetical protein